MWREQWARITNKFLDEANRTEAHIDHRSHAARGLDEQPTIHEGYVARTIERKGFVADRCEINRQIKADNALLRELKAAMRKISQTVISSSSRQRHRTKDKAPRPVYESDLSPIHGCRRANHRKEKRTEGTSKSKEVHSRPADSNSARSVPANRKADRGNRRTEIRKAAFDERAKMRR